MSPTWVHHSHSSWNTNIYFSKHASFLWSSSTDVPQCNQRQCEPSCGWSLYQSKIKIKRTPVVMPRAHLVKLSQPTQQLCGGWLALVVPFWGANAERWGTYCLGKACGDTALCLFQFSSRELRTRGCHGNLSVSVWYTCDGELGRGSSTVAWILGGKGSCRYVVAPGLIMMIT